jgi:hypothetical protein
MTLSFRDYIQSRRVTDTPAGDFVADAKQDGRLPDAQSWADLQSYMWGRGASSSAVDAAKTVWQRYLAARRKALTQP